jgi:intracellular sulfur oxidation DsrE/DsrF family protein
MRFIARLSIAVCCLLVALPLRAEPPNPNRLRIDVPVVLREAKIVFNLDHLAFEGDEPTGLEYLRLLVVRFRADRTQGRIVAIFHGAAGYMTLNDPVYNRVRNWQHGNPYEDQIAALIRDGVDIEECAQTMADNHWGNADLLPGVKVTTSATLRIIQLVQDGFVQLQP